MRGERRPDEKEGTYATRQGAGGAGDEGGGKN